MRDAVLGLATGHGASDPPQPVRTVMAAELQEDASRLMELTRKAP